MNASVSSLRTASVGSVSVLSSPCSGSVSRTGGSPKPDRSDAASTGRMDAHYKCGRVCFADGLIKAAFFSGGRLLLQREYLPIAAVAVADRVRQTGEAEETEDRGKGWSRSRACPQSEFCTRQPCFEAGTERSVRSAS